MPPSLYQTLVNEFADELPVIMCTKSTLVHLSHTLEDMVLKYRLPALLFTGFQESSHWRKETERYRALAGVAHQVCIFAGEPLPHDSAASVLQIKLRPDDPMRQEWFLLVMSDRFSAVLCGEDNHAPVEREGLRQFNTIWTFNPAKINRVLDLLERVLADYRPDVLPGLLEARQRYDVGVLDGDMIAQFTLEMVRYEEQLHVTITQERELSSLKNRFLTMVSHEFRTPLTIIQSSIEMLERYRERMTMERQHERMGIMREQIQLLVSMLNDISSVSHLQTGYVQVKWIEIDLPAFCQQLVEDVKSFSAESHPIHLTFGTLPRVVRGDTKLLRHILRNLLENALKYSPPESAVEFHVEVQANSLVFTVSDHGIGISNEDQVHVFEPFFRGRNTEFVVGTGLGLKIVAESVQTYGGEITLNSTLNQGTTITVRLPFSPPVDVE